VTIRFAYDTHLKRPGCVLLQAALGGDIAAVNRFPVDSWLLAPTDNLRVYDIPTDLFDELVALAEAGSRLEAK